MNDGALADLMVRDSDAGLAAVYERYADRIHDYCRSILRDDADAADAAQDTFLAASARIAQLRDRDRLRPWLYAIARNRCHRTLRDRKRQRPTDDIDQAMSAADPVDSRRLESSEAQALVWEAAAGLEDPDRDVLDLHLRHGLTGADLAAAMGTTAPQANQALHRMRERLNRSVGATLAIRYGRSDCEELRNIVGHDSLTPLLRKRVARHIEQCGLCERHRYAGASVFASIPFVGMPGSVWAGLAARAADPGAAEQVASTMEWNETGFPGSSRPVAQPSEALRRSATRQPRIGQPGLRQPRIRPPAIAAAAAVVLLVAIGALLLARTAAGPDSTEAAAPPPIDSDIDPATDDDPATSATTAPESSSSSGTAPSSPSSTSSPTVTAAPPGDDPSTSSTTSITVASVPTVTFIADGQAPMMSLAIDCDFPLVITATLSDNLDPEPSGDLDVTWPPARTRPIPAPVSGSVYRLAIEAEDLSGLNGTVDFNVSGRITDQAGNISDVADSVSCIFIDDS